MKTRMSILEGDEGRTSFAAAAAPPAASPAPALLLSVLLRSIPSLSATVEPPPPLVLPLLPPRPSPTEQHQHNSSRNISGFKRCRRRLRRRPSLPPVGRSVGRSASLPVSSPLRSYMGVTSQVGHGAHPPFLTSFWSFLLLPAAVAAETAPLSSKLPHLARNSRTPSGPSFQRHSESCDAMRRWSAPPSIMRAFVSAQYQAGIFATCCF